MSKNTKKEAVKIESVDAGPGASDLVDFNDNDFVSNLDESLINELKEKLEDRKSEIRTKVYAVSCTKEIFSLYRDFIINRAEWNSQKWTIGDFGDESYWASSASSTPLILFDFLGGSIESWAKGKLRLVRNIEK